MEFKKRLELFLIHRHQLFISPIPNSYDISGTPLYNFMTVGDIIFANTEHCTKFKIIGRNTYNSNFIAMCVNHCKELQVPSVTFSICAGIETHDSDYKILLQSRLSEHKEYQKYISEKLLLKIPPVLINLILAYDD